MSTEPGAKDCLRPKAAQSFIEAVACAMIWSVMAAEVPGEFRQHYPDARLDEQHTSPHLEITRAYSMFDGDGVTEERTKDMLKVQQSAPLADAKIAEEVKAAVRRDPDVRTVDVVVFVSRGVGTLSGTVSTAQQKSRAEQLASQVEDVAAVVNKITVSDVHP